MSPASGAPKSEGKEGDYEPKMFPGAVLSDQEAIENMEAEPIVLGTAPYSSPDPATDGIRMLPLEEQGTGGTVGVKSAAEANEAAAEERDKDMKAGQWKELVDGAADEAALEEIESRYLDSGADFKTVDEAIEKKREEFGGENGENGDNGETANE